jgi:predicted nucleic acid-binding Zn ribbon protein
MRRVAPRPLARALESVTATLAPATTLARVQAVWADVVGEGVATESRATAERDGVVFVTCRSSVWAQELELLGPELVERLGAAGVSVEALRFRVGE